jgi:hypothetical protein
MEKECWLPPLELFEDYDREWKTYEAMLYKVFKADFIDSQPKFEGKQVNTRKHPMEHDKEEAFFHVTCQDYTKTKDRAPDFRRCERIRWIRSFIENYNCDSAYCIDCGGIKVWEEDAPKGTYKRSHLLFEEERYLVVIEKRNTYCLLVTAFYIEQDHLLDTKLKRYNTYIKMTCSGE